MAPWPEKVQATWCEGKTGLWFAYGNSQFVHASCMARWAVSLIIVAERVPHDHKDKSLLAKPEWGSSGLSRPWSVFSKLISLLLSFQIAFPAAIPLISWVGLSWEAFPNPSLFLQCFSKHWQTGCWLFQTLSYQQNKICSKWLQQTG